MLSQKINSVRAMADGPMAGLLVFMFFIYLFLLCLINTPFRQSPDTTVGNA